MPVYIRFLLKTWYCQYVAVSSSTIVCGNDLCCYILFSRHAISGLFYWRIFADVFLAWIMGILFASLNLITCFTASLNVAATLYAGMVVLVVIAYLLCSILFDIDFTFLFKSSSWRCRTSGSTDCGSHLSGFSPLLPETASKNLSGMYLYSPKEIT